MADHRMVSRSSARSSRHQTSSSMSVKPAGVRGGAGIPRASAEYRWWWAQTRPGVVGPVTASIGLAPVPVGPVLLLVGGSHGQGVPPLAVVGVQGGGHRPGGGYKADLPHSFDPVGRTGLRRFD